MNKLLKYNEAKLKVLNRIGELNLKAGDTLPSQGELMKGASFSMISLRRALDDLQADGIIEKRQGCPMRLIVDLSQAPSLSTVVYISIPRDQPYPTYFNIDSTPTVNSLVSFFSERGIRFETITAASPNAEVTEKLSGVLGVILCGWITQEWVDFIRVFKLPVVVAGNNPFPEEFSGVSHDWPAAVDMLYTELEKHGARRIAFLNSSKDYYPTAGMYEAFRNRAPDFSESMVHCCNYYDHFNGLADFLIANRNADAFLVEKGLVFQFLAVSREFPGMDKKLIGVISEGKLNLNFEFKKMLATYFGDTIFVEAGKFFLEKISSQDHTITHRIFKPMMQENITCNPPKDKKGGK